MYFCKNHLMMNKKILAIALRWGIIIGLLQIISICLQVYFFQDTLVTLIKGLKIISLLISFYFIYRAIYDYKKTFDSSQPFPLLQAVYVGVLASLFFTVVFLLLFLLVKFTIPNPKMIINTQLIKDLQFLNLFFFAVAMVVAVFMQRKEDDTTNANNENK